MTDFLTCAACHGQRPRGLASRRIIERPDLLSMLMDERQVARFLIAPPGYGKTTVALEYAQTVFGLSHVFWIEGGGPCFLRDLDAGTMAEEVLKRDSAPVLVVLSHVPAVGTQRADELSRCIDVWLAHNVEVIVTLTPGSDSFARRQPDRVCVVSEQLALAAEEETEEEARFDNARIPALAWGGESAMSEFAWGLAHEALPHDLALLFFSVLVLGSCDFSELQQLTRLANLTALESVLSYYPHLGYRSDVDSFSAIEVPIEPLAKAYRSRLNLFLPSSNAEDVGEMLLQLAEALVARGQGERACDLIRLMAPAQPRRVWALTHGESLVTSLKPLALHLLLEKVRYVATPEGVHLVLLQSLCLILLDRTREGSSAAVRVLRSTSASDDDRRMAAFVLLRWGDVSQRQRAAQEMASQQNAFNAYQGVQWALSQDGISALDVWREFSERDVPWDDLAYAATLLAPTYPQEMALPLMEYLEQSEKSASLSLVQYMAVKACRESEELSYVGGPLPVELVVPYYDTRSDLVRQQASYATMIEKPQAWPMRPVLKEFAEVKKEPSADPLTVHLFGGLEVFIGGTLVDPGCFGRKQVRVLLAILVLNPGRELSMERLSSSLWPKSTRASSRKNFYAIWSMLRQPFTSPEGACPYFLHSRGGYRVDGRLLVTDVGRVEEICDELRLDEVSVTVWGSRLKELERLCDGELLPGEDSNGMVLSAREEYRVKVVNALTAASERLLAAGEHRLALSFAQSARKREKYREDVSYALAAAQLACGRREDALNTYNMTKRYLADHLGIDPSPRMVRLYRTIIESEEDF